MPFPGQVQSITGGNRPTPTPRKRNRTVLIEDESFIVKDQVPLNGTITFTVTASGRKRYSGNIINDGTTSFQVQIETTRKWISDWITLKAGDSLDFDRYPLSGITLKGVDGKFTFSGWAAGERYGGYVKRISSSISSSSTMIGQSEIIDASGNILGVFPSVGGAFAMPIRQLTAALDTLTANQGTSPWVENLSQIGGTSATGLIDTDGPQLVTLNMAKGVTTIIANSNPFGVTSTTPFYTVNAGKILYLAGYQCTASANSVGFASGNLALQVDTGGNGTFRTLAAAYSLGSTNLPSSPVGIGLGVLMPIVTASVFRVFVSGVNVCGFGSIIGLEK